MSERTRKWDELRVSKKVLMERTAAHPEIWTVEDYGRGYYSIIPHPGLSQEDEAFWTDWLMAPPEACR